MGKADPGKSLTPKIQCPHCGHSWVPKKVAPKCCPKCRKGLSWPRQKETRRGLLGKAKALLLPSLLTLIIQFLLDKSGIAGS